MVIRPAASPDDARAFILAQTSPIVPPGCPGIRLALASEVTPLWHATEDFLQERNLDPPYWAFAWVGGQALAATLLEQPDLVRGKRVLDFAAGCGIGSIAAALAGASAVTAAEIDPMAIAATLLNCEQNGTAVSVLSEDLLDSDDCRWDVILAGDVCYERTMAERVIAWLRRCAAQGAEILLADPGRAYLPKTGLLKLAERTIATSLEVEGATSKTVVIYRIVG